MSYVVNHPILIPACNKYTVFKIGSDITIVYIYGNAIYCKYVEGGPDREAPIFKCSLP